jgi:hypothetical protein
MVSVDARGERGMCVVEVNMLVGALIAIRCSFKTVAQAIGAVLPETSPGWLIGSYEV